MKPAQGEISGDYDPDDDYRHPRTNDADNDDITTPKDKDNDADSSGHSYYDPDDRDILTFGHSANKADSHAIALVVRRYFAASAASDGATACTLIVRSLAASVAEDLGRPPGPQYSRGTSCTIVMSETFTHFHRQLATHAASLKVSHVRIKGSQSLVTLAFKGLPGRQVEVIKEHDTWKIGTLLDRELP